MAILKDVETNAATIKNPNGYVRKAAQRALETGGVAPQKKRPREEEPPQARIEKQIDWLNKHVGADIVISEVMEALLSVDIQQAMKILKRVETEREQLQD